MTARELLEIIQLTGDSVRSNTEFAKDVERSLGSGEYRFVVDRIFESNKKMPTDFQDSHFYNIISGAFETLNDILNNQTVVFQGKPIQKRALPLYGTVSLKGYNAFVETVDEPVIVFNNELLMFTQAILEIYSKEHWLRSKKLITKHLQDLLTRHFIDVMLCFYSYANPYYAIPLELCEFNNYNDLDIPQEINSSFENLFSDEFLNFSFHIDLATYLWIVSHEYSHLVLGHLDSAQKAVVKRNIANVTVSETHFVWQEEYDADVLATTIVDGYPHTYFGATGVYLALMCLNLSSLEIDAFTSHPPIELRKQNIINFLLKKNPRNITACRNVDAILLPKFQAFKDFLNHIDSNDLTFSPIRDLQEYIYKKFPLA